MRAVNQTEQTRPFDNSSTKQTSIPAESEVTREEISITDKKVNFTEGIEDPEDTAVDSVESVNGGSDIDDVPDVKVDGRALIVTKKRRLVRFDLAAFFSSDTYKTLSFLFGPLICCFVVAM